MTPVESFTSPHPATLSDLLVRFLLTQRWYRDKTRTIHKAELGDVIQIPGTSICFITLQLAYGQGDSQTYLVAMGAQSAVDEAPAASLPRESIIAELEEPERGKGVLYDAFFSPSFCQLLLESIASKTVFSGEFASIQGGHTHAFERILNGQPLAELAPKLSRAEQSNTSIIFGNRFILKIFRKLEEGVNPDIEIGMFLTERNFPHSPAVAGSFEYCRPHHTAVYVGILQEFVPNQGDAWAYTLETLSGYFKKALFHGGSLPERTTSHPLDLMDVVLPAEAQSLIGSYLESARLLGDRTARMHTALTDSGAGVAFSPEAFTKEDREALFQGLLRQAREAFALLRDQQPGLSQPAAEDARRLLAAEDDIRVRFAPLLDSEITAFRIRHHGDYHLGQVLYTGSDFLIIDYEGEPARSLAERRMKRLAMKDVAGMIRSFQYASYAALFGKVPGIEATPETMPILEIYAAFWTAWVSAVFLKAYFDAADNAPFVPASAEERRLLFDAFLLEKALYEVSYELNNRPAWVTIPLRGILSLLN